MRRAEDFTKTLQKVSKKDFFLNSTVILSHVCIIKFQGKINVTGQQFRHLFVHGAYSNSAVIPALHFCFQKLWLCRNRSLTRPPKKSAGSLERLRRWRWKQNRVTQNLSTKEFVWSPTRFGDFSVSFLISRDIHRSPRPMLCVRASYAINHEEQ